MGTASVLSRRDGGGTAGGGGRKGEGGNSGDGGACGGGVDGGNGGGGDGRGDLGGVIGGCCGGGEGNGGVGGGFQGVKSQLSTWLEEEQMQGTVPFRPVKNWKDVSVAHADLVLSYSCSLRMAISVRAFSFAEPKYDQSACRKTIIL